MVLGLRKPQTSYYSPFKQIKGVSNSLETPFLLLFKLLESHYTLFNFSNVFFFLQISPAT